ncbi:MAG: choloylglycine hydrolase family protein [Simkaniaceae bacterium]|nr:choloylglycine hydrolase family protein [Candidatus Sacchlamyda saccharinae]
MKILCALLSCCCVKLFCCTDFKIMAQDKTVVNGRSMEFGTDLQSELIIFPRGLKQQSRLEGSKPGMSWTTKYAAIGMNVFGLDVLIDGMNEKGLSIGGLWLPGTIYPQEKGGDQKQMVSLMDLGNWILGSFASIEEVKKALKTVEVVPEKIAKLGEVPPLHFSLHDAQGSSLVIEFSSGEMKLYENKVGVLTNAPEFPWHETNLRNYLNLSAVNAAPINVDGSVLSPTGQGSGLLGIPGDWTPPSRFVRIAIFKNLVAVAKNAKQNSNLAFHLLNTVDIPYGAIRDRKDQEFDYTQWVVVKDLANRKMYWRTYGNLNIREMDFSEALKLAKNQVKTLPL